MKRDNTDVYFSEEGFVIVKHFNPLNFPDPVSDKDKERILNDQGHIFNDKNNVELHDCIKEYTLRKDNKWKNPFYWGNEVLKKGIDQTSIQPIVLFRGDGKHNHDKILYCIRNGLNTVKFEGPVSKSLSTKIAYDYALSNEKGCECMIMFLYPNKSKHIYIRSESEEFVSYPNEEFNVYRFDYKGVNIYWPGKTTVKSGKKIVELPTFLLIFKGTY